MKKCKSCQSEIDNKAKKCPHCQADQRSWFRRHPILTVLLGFFILAMVSGALTEDTTTQSANNAVDEQTEEVEASEEEPAQEPMVIQVNTLGDAFDANQVAAEKEWGGKLVQFDAEISNITDHGIAFYKVASDPYSITQISCRIKDKEQLLSVTNGEIITVKGVVGTQSIGVIGLSECEVVTE